MATYNEQISRSEMEALVPEDAANEILKGIDEGSSVLKLAKRLPNMSTRQRRVPVLDLLPTAYFVQEKGKSYDTDNFGTKKQTTQLQWANKYINAEEIACIIAIHESALEDADFDIWGESREPIINAIGKVIDTAMLYGDNTSDVPATWPDGVINGMPSAHLITENSVDTDLYDDILSEGGLFNLVEEDGFFVNGALASISLRAKLRGLRDSNGIPIFQKSMQDPTQWELDGAPLIFPRNGAYDATQSLLIVGDWTQMVYAIRKDITFKVFTEGVITDNSSPPQIQHNLLQEDMLALRVTFRMGWQLPNPTNAVNSSSATRYPFSALAPSASA